MDGENKLFAIGNIAKTYKPLLSEGSAKEIIIEVVIEVANASEITIYGRYSFSNKRVCKK